MQRGQAHLHLLIERGSEPITGSYAAADGSSSRFSGWIELVAAIERMRLTADGEREPPLVDLPRSS